MEVATLTLTAGGLGRGLAHPPSPTGDPFAQRVHGLTKAHLNGAWISAHNASVESTALLSRVTLPDVPRHNLADW